MSGGYWVVWSSEGVARASWSSGTSGAPRSSRTSRCSSKGNVEGVVDMLWVLMLRANGRFSITSRYNGL